MGATPVSLRHVLESKEGTGFLQYSPASCDAPPLFNSESQKSDTLPITDAGSNAENATILKVNLSEPSRFPTEFIDHPPSPPSGLSGVSSGILLDAVPRLGSPVTSCCSPSSTPTTPFSCYPPPPSNPLDENPLYDDFRSCGTSVCSAASNPSQSGSPEYRQRCSVYSGSLTKLINSSSSWESVNKSLIDATSLRASCSPRSSRTQLDDMSLPEANVTCNPTYNQQWDRAVEDLDHLIADIEAGSSHSILLPLQRVKQALNELQSKVQYQHAENAAVLNRLMRMLMRQSHEHGHVMHSSMEKSMEKQISSQAEVISKLKLRLLGAQRVIRSLRKDQVDQGRKFTDKATSPYAHHISEMTGVVGQDIPKSGQSTPTAENHSAIDCTQIMPLKRPRVAHWNDVDLYLSKGNLRDDPFLSTPDRAIQQHTVQPQQHQRSFLDRLNNAVSSVSGNMDAEPDPNAGPVACADEKRHPATIPLNTATRPGTSTVQQTQSQNVTVSAAASPTYVHGMNGDEGKALMKLTTTRATSPIVLRHVECGANNYQAPVIATAETSVVYQPLYINEPDAGKICGPEQKANYICSPSAVALAFPELATAPACNGSLLAKLASSTSTSPLPSRNNQDRLHVYPHVHSASLLVNAAAAAAAATRYSSAEGGVDTEAETEADIEIESESAAEAESDTEAQSYESNSPANQYKEGTSRGMVCLANAVQCVSTPAPGFIHASAAFHTLDSTDELTLPLIPTFWIENNRQLRLPFDAVTQTNVATAAAPTVDHAVRAGNRPLASSISTASSPRNPNSPESDGSDQHGALQQGSPNNGPVAVACNMQYAQQLDPLEACSPKDAQLMVVFKLQDVQQSQPALPEPPKDASASLGMSQSTCTTIPTRSDVTAACAAVTESESVQLQNASDAQVVGASHECKVAEQQDPRTVADCAAASAGWARVVKTSLTALPKFPPVKQAVHIREQSDINVAGVKGKGQPGINAAVSGTAAFAGVTTQQPQVYEACPLSVPNLMASSKCSTIQTLPKADTLQGKVLQHEERGIDSLQGGLLDVEGAITTAQGYPGARATAEPPHPNNNAHKTSCVSLHELLGITYGAELDVQHRSTDGHVCYTIKPSTAGSASPASPSPSKAISPQQEIMVQKPLLAGLVPTRTQQSPVKVEHGGTNVQTSLVPTSHMPTVAPIALTSKADCPAAGESPSTKVSTSMQVLLSAPAGVLLTQTSHRCVSHSSPAQTATMSPPQTQPPSPNLASFAPRSSDSIEEYILPASLPPLSSPLSSHQPPTSSASCSVPNDTLPQFPLQEACPTSTDPSTRQLLASPRCPHVDTLTSQKAVPPSNPDIPSMLELIQAWVADAEQIAMEHLRSIKLCDGRLAWEEVPPSVFSESGCNNTSAQLEPQICWGPRKDLDVPKSASITGVELAHPGGKMEALVNCKVTGGMDAVNSGGNPDMVAWSNQKIDVLSPEIRSDVDAVGCITGDQVDVVEPSDQIRLRLIVINSEVSAEVQVVNSEVTRTFGLGVADANGTIGVAGLNSETSCRPPTAKLDISPFVYVHDTEEKPVTGIEVDEVISESKHDGRDGSSGLIKTDTSPQQPAKTMELAESHDRPSDDAQGANEHKEKEGREEAGKTAELSDSLHGATAQDAAAAGLSTHPDQHASEVLDISTCSAAELSSTSADITPRTTSMTHAPLITHTAVQNPMIMVHFSAPWQLHAAYHGHLPSIPPMYVIPEHACTNFAPQQPYINMGVAGMPPFNNSEQPYVYFIPDVAAPFISAQQAFANTVTHGTPPLVPLQEPHTPTTATSLSSNQSFADDIPAHRPNISPSVLQLAPGPSSPSSADPTSASKLGKSHVTQAVGNDGPGIPAQQTSEQRSASRNTGKQRSWRQILSGCVTGAVCICPKVQGPPHGSPPQPQLQLDAPQASTLSDDTSRQEDQRRA